jgi:transposase-like protein
VPNDLASARLYLQLRDVTVSRTTSVELDDHLGFARHEQSASSKNRNGFSSKTLQTEDGQFTLDTPRDRAGSFEPQLNKKHQRRFTSMDDKIKVSQRAVHVNP